MARLGMHGRQDSGRRTVSKIPLLQERCDEEKTAVARLGVHGRRNLGPEAISQRSQSPGRCKSGLPEAKRRRKKEVEADNAEEGYGCKTGDGGAARGAKEFRAEKRPLGKRWAIGADCGVVARIPPSITLDGGSQGSEKIMVEAGADDDDDELEASGTNAARSMRFGVQNACKNSQNRIDAAKVHKNSLDGKKLADQDHGGGRC